MSQRTPRIDSPASAGMVFELVRNGRARTRKDISSLTGLAPSTVSLRVDSLLEHGWIREGGEEESTGGRQARTLAVRGDKGVVAAASLGAHHAKVLVADLAGAMLHSTEIPIDVHLGPAATLSSVWAPIAGFLGADSIDAGDLRGFAVGIPAPVDPRVGAIFTAAQLPGWDRVPLYDELRALTPAHTLVENDANLMAMAEFGFAPPTTSSMLAIKIGGRIGSGVIVDGKLYSGAGGAAGEISHSPTDGTSTIECFCGVDNCLESVASGSAIAAKLRSDGFSVANATELVELAGTGNPHVLQTLREAGQLVGSVLVTITNFLNPSLMTFGGSLSQIDSFVAAIRGAVFQRCLPVVSAGLEIRLGSAGEDSEVLGGIQLLLERQLTAESVDRSIAGRGAEATTG